MGHNNYFQFKQFLIRQDKSAMRVGTDGVLLGAWTNVSDAKNILDIGTGTGLIAIMLAQRSDAKIKGIEIETQAANEAKQNAENSPWADRVKIKNLSFQEFATKTDQKFDVIVSNPPYFTNAVKNKQNEKSLARPNHQLPFNDLLQGATNIMTTDGKLSVILPVNEAVEFTNKAKEFGLSLSRLTEVIPMVKKEPNRQLVEFTRTKRKIQKKYLPIYEENGVDYTNEYKKLTAGFYLNF